MAPRKQLHSSFLPATWWNDQQISQWKARPLLHREIRAKAKRRGDWTKMMQIESGASGKRTAHVIAVTDEAFCGGEEFAKALAERLGLRYVDSAVLLEWAAAKGGDPEELRAALKSAPNVLDRFTRRRLNQVLLLQAALAESVREGNAVCYGVAADLLAVEQVLRIFVQASHRFRRLQVQESLGLQRAKAERYLNACDRKRRRWLLYLFGTGKGTAHGLDLIVNPEQASFDASYATVCEMIRGHGRFSITNLTQIEHFALSTSVKAAFARDPDTAYLDLNVEIHDGKAIVHGLVRSIEEIESIKRVPLHLPEGITIDLSQLQLGGPDYMPGFFTGQDYIFGNLTAKSLEPALRSLSKQSLRRSPVWLRPAWLWGGVSVAALLTLSGPWVWRTWFSSLGAHRQTLTGVITDSQCGLSHNGDQPTAACVRSCVRTAGAKYVLDDGAQVLVLADQRLGEQFAGMRVIATGFVDKSSQSLQVHAMRAAAN